MKERVPSRVEVTLHLMGTAATLIQEVLKKVGCNVSNAGDCVAAEVFNHRIARVLVSEYSILIYGVNCTIIYN